MPLDFTTTRKDGLTSTQNITCNIKTEREWSRRGFGRGNFKVHSVLYSRPHKRTHMTTRTKYLAAGRSFIRTECPKEQTVTTVCYCSINSWFVCLFCVLLLAVSEQENKLCWPDRQGTTAHGTIINSSLQMMKDYTGDRLSEEEDDDYWNRRKLQENFCLQITSEQRGSSSLTSSLSSGHLAAHWLYTQEQSLRRNLQLVQHYVGQPELMRPPPPTSYGQWRRWQQQRRRITTQG